MQTNRTCTKTFIVSAFAYLLLFGNTSRSFLELKMLLGKHSSFMQFLLD